MDYSHMFEGKCAVIFVIDVLEDYKEAIDKLVHTLSGLSRKDMLQNIEVFTICLHFITSMLEWQFSRK